MSKLIRAFIQFAITELSILEKGGRRVRCVEHLFLDQLLYTAFTWIIKRPRSGTTRFFIRQKLFERSLWILSNGRQELAKPPQKPLDRNVLEYCSPVGRVKSPVLQTFHNLEHEIKFTGLVN